MASHLVLSPVATTSTSYPRSRPDSVVIVDVAGENDFTLSVIKVTSFDIRDASGHRKSLLGRSPEPTKVLPNVSRGNSYEQ